MSIVRSPRQRCLANKLESAQNPAVLEINLALPRKKAIYYPPIQLKGIVLQREWTKKRKLKFFS